MGLTHTHTAAPLLGAGEGGQSTPDRQGRVSKLATLLLLLLTKKLRKTKLHKKKIL